MKSTILIICILASSTSMAAPRSLYNKVYNDCVDYGHSKLTEEEVSSCEREAKNAVLSNKKMNQAYMDCIDYGHVMKTKAQEKACLIEASIPQN